MKTSKNKKKQIFALSVIVGLFLFLSLLVLLTNNQWVPLYFPAPLWSDSPYWLGFETKINLLILICFFFGALLISFLWLFLYKDLMKQNHQINCQNTEITQKLKKVEMLFKTSQDNYLSESKKHE